MPHEERNDALRRNNKIAVQRYQFAINCLGPNKTVIDYGCGMGYGCHMLRKKGHDVIGIDNSEQAIEYAHKNYPGAYLVRDIEDEQTIKEVDGDEVAVCLEALCHLKDPKKFIDYITNSSAQQLIISAPIDPNPKDGYHYRLHNLSEKQFKNLLKDWEIIKEMRQKQYLAIYAIKI